MSDIAAIAGKLEALADAIPDDIGTLRLLGAAGRSDLAKSNAIAPIFAEIERQIREARDHLISKEML